MAQTVSVQNPYFLDTCQLVPGLAGALECCYVSRWSLKPLLRKYSAELSEEQLEWLRALEAELEKQPEGPAQDQPPVDTADAARLLEFFFPKVNALTRLGALSRPMHPSQQLATEDWARLMRSGHIEIKASETQQLSTIQAGLLILHQHYGQPLEHLQQRQISYREANTGLKSYYSLLPSFEYIEVALRGDKPQLRTSEIRELLANPENRELWLERLPPAHFEFQGIQLDYAIEYTADASRTQLLSLLMRRDALIDDEQMQEMQSVLRNFLRVPDLQWGIQSMDYPRSRSRRNSPLIRYDLLADEVKDILSPDYADSVYVQAAAFGKIRIIDDLKACADEIGPLEKLLIEKGLRSLILVPLMDGAEKVIGMLELASTKPGAFSNLVLYQLETVVPLFRQSIKSSRDEMEARVQRVMRQTFTSLDPSVEWRFTEAAADMIAQEQQAEEEQPILIPEIRFEEVWAFYAQADIVGSSRLRNEAMRTDLLLELSAAEKLLSDAKVRSTFPLAGKLNYDIQELRRLLDASMSPADEQQVQDFIEFAFRPMLSQLKEDPQQSRAVLDYLLVLKEGRPSGKTQREVYEDSVRLVTGLLSRLVNARQKAAQRIVSHYFSKYRTDGIEFNLYAGESLLEDGVFTEVQLQNLRLWQLQTMVDITKAMARLQERLEMKMETAQLIFVFGTPITIQFRMDEKRFDVEGAYNVRYEVLKKRIDKAMILGTEERLTQPNHVSIVYSHHSDEKLYRELIEYLHGSGEVVGQAEHYELEPMQGVDGLKALRVRVL